MALVGAAPDEREGPFSHQLQSWALPQPLPGPCSQGIWKGSFKNQEKPLYITAKWTWVSSVVLQHLLQRLPLDSGQENLFRFPGVVGCMFPCSFAHHIFLTKCKISLSCHNLSLFLSFFLPSFLFSLFLTDLFSAQLDLWSQEHKVVFFSFWKDSCSVMGKLSGIIIPNGGKKSTE